MKLVASFVMLILIGMAFPAQTKPAKDSLSSSAYRVSSQAKLQLTTSVVKQVSCTSNLLSLDLRFTFRNVGAVPIILDKRSSIVARHWISRDLQAMASKKYVESVGYEDSGPRIPDTLEVPEDMSNFVTLQPGEFYETESDWTRVGFAVNDGTPHMEAGLDYRSYFLQVEVGTWLYAPDSIAKRARKKWRNQGYLWTEPLMSLPLQFTVEKNRPISECR